MASKLGGDLTPLGGSDRSQIAPCAYAAPESSLHTDRNSQSNRSRSNPTAPSPRHPGAERGVGGVLGSPPTYAPLLRGGEPALATRWNDVEAPAPWLRSAPHVGGDRRTTGRLTAIATNTLAVKGSTPEGRIPPWGGQYSELLRVRAYTACRCVRTYTDDDTVPRDSRSAPNLNLREEGRRISQGSGADHGGRRVLSRHFAHQTVSALRGAGAVAHPSRRGISSGDARPTGKREAQVGHLGGLRPAEVVQGQVWICGDNLGPRRPRNRLPHLPHPNIDRLHVQSAGELMGAAPFLDEKLCR